MGAFDIAREATNTTERAESLCRDGEKLSKAEGPTTYLPTQGYARAVAYTCTDGAGVRRDVTEEFGNGLLDDSLDKATGFATRLLLSIGVMMLGSVLLVAGIVMKVKGMIPSFSGAGHRAVNFQTVDLRPTARTEAAARPAADPADGLAQRLRALQVARDAGLLSAEEYERLRADTLAEA